MTDSLITVTEARALVLEAATLLDSESVPIADAIDRVLAYDVTATGDVPAFPCSAMDGYAVTAGPGGRTLEVVGESRAGLPSELPLIGEQAIRISTGAAVPEGATAVIRQEDVERKADNILTVAPVEPGANVRGPGEDLRSGATVLKTGTRLGAAELGATVAAGAGAVIVAKRPRVSVLCTGDELRAAGEPLGPGEIHNSNAPMLVALGIRAGGLVRPAEILRDDRDQTERALGAALDGADVVVVSGGVSVGPHDHVKPALGALGVQERFWGVALQPGKPTWFGVRGSTLVFGLPGNPVSAVVTFLLFARPALEALQGASPESRQDREAVLGASVRQSSRREQALRVRLERTDGRLVAVPNGPQGSHIVSSLVGADALALIPPGTGELEPGTTVALEPIEN